MHIRSEAQSTRWRRVVEGVGVADMFGVDVDGGTSLTMVPIVMDWLFSRRCFRVRHGWWLIRHGCLALFHNASNWCGGIVRDVSAKLTDLSIGTMNFQIGIFLRNRKLNRNRKICFQWGKFALGQKNKCPLLL
jgi:hypothetical protein